MASRTLSCLILSAFLILIFLGVVRSDEPCAYPCYPPPTGVSGEKPPVSLSPPNPQTGASYTPPTAYNTPGYGPNFPSPPYGGGGGGGGGDGGGGGGGFYGPPPPDPILPYFPFYYKKPPHQTEKSGSSVRGTSASFPVVVANVAAVALLGGSWSFN